MICKLEDCGLLWLATLSTLLAPVFLESLVYRFYSILADIVPSNDVDKVGAAIDRSFISGYFLTAQTYKCIRLITPVAMNY